MLLSQRLTTGVMLLALAGFSARLALSLQTAARSQEGQTASARDLRNGFGRIETISGTIAAVDDRGIIVLRRVGPSEPATTDLTVTESREDPNGPARITSVQAQPGPGRTEYNFRVTPSTRITVNGQSQTLQQIAGVQDEKANVEFVPRRSGNFATKIEIHH